jgi:hypothetical protein
MLEINLAAGKAIVGECGVWTYEHVILDREAVPELHTAFDRHAIAYDHEIFYENSIADVAITSQFRSREYMTESPNASAGTYGRSLA